VSVVKGVLQRTFLFQLM